MGDSGHSRFDEIEYELASLDIAEADRAEIMREVRVKAAQSVADRERRDLAINVALARKIHRSRLRANDLIGARILCDPKFEMLLEMFVNHHEGRKLCIGDLCLSANVPQTTGLRHMEKLEAHGFLKRFADPLDGRRWWVEPTPRALDGISAVLNDLRNTD